MSEKSPRIERKPELEPNTPELAPIDRLGELKTKLSKGKEVSKTDVEGLQEVFQDLFKSRGADYESVLTAVETENGGFKWGKNYAEQYLRLEAIFGASELQKLEDWGASLLEARGRGKKRDASTKKRGVIIPQVLLDFYRFSCDPLNSELAKMGDESLVDKLNGRMANWVNTDSDVKNPTPCSGELLSLAIDYLQTGDRKSDLTVD